MKPLRLNQHGFTLIEILVTMGLIVTVVLAVTTSLRMSQQFLMRVRNTRNRDRVVGSTLKNVVENISLFQKNFNTAEGWTQSMLDPKNLPIAWDDNTMTDAASCPSCPGRMGFIIQPVDGMPGLNRLTIRVTHTTLIQGYQDYVYILPDE